MNENTQVAISTQTSSLVLDVPRMEAMMTMAKIMAEGKATLPKHFQGSPADCLAVIMQAMQWQMNPFAVAQKTHIVNGTLGYEAQLVNAVVQTSGAITGAFKYEYRGEGNQLECRAGAVLRGETQVTWGEWLLISTVKTKNSPLWATNPKQQLGYLQVKNWARLYCPGAILGVYSTDELEDYSAPKVINPEEGSAAPARPLAAAYPDESFNANFPKWKTLIESGKKTPQDIIASIESKATLSESQRGCILAIQPAINQE